MVWREGVINFDREKITYVLNGRVILLIDDAEDVVQMMATLLEKFGAKVYPARSSQEGLDVLSQFTPDIIISDLEMPEEDGYTFIRKVRQNASWQDIPAIALTAHIGDEDQRLAIEAGYQLHLAKPVQTMELVAAINKILPRTPV